MKKYGVFFGLVVFIFSFFVGSSENKDVALNNYSLEDLTLDEKIGQMLFVEYRSDNYTSDFYEAIDKYKPGGFILYIENLWDKGNYFELVNHLKKSSKIPIFIGIDQEGGYIQRLKSLGDIKLTKLKSFEELRKEDLVNTFLAGKVTSEELASFGINVNFSPVLDLASFRNKEQAEIIFSRSFSTDENEVAKYGKTYILGLNNNSVISCAKHLPGIGDGTENTHYDSSYILKSKSELEEKELVPFKENSKYLDMIMISHDTIPCITGDRPLTLSKDGIDYLKKYLDYDGLIVSDGLRMDALTRYYSTDDILVGVINAGVDVLLAPEKMSKTVKIIKDAVIDGRIAESKIDESVEKILKVKSKLKQGNYEMNDFYREYHNLLLKYKYNDFNLIDNYIFNSRN